MTFQSKQHHEGTLPNPQKQNEEKRKTTGAKRKKVRGIRTEVGIGDSRAADPYRQPRSPQICLAPRHSLALAPVARRRDVAAW